MKEKLYTICISIGLFLMLGCKEKSKNAPITVPETNTSITDNRNEIEFKDLEGNPVSLADFKGQRVLVNYWATWCRPCIEEMPALLRAQEILEEENYIFLLASDQPVKTIKAFVERKDYDFKYIRLNGSMAAQGISALPTTFVYNELGERAEIITGSVEWDTPEMIQKLKEIK